MATARGRRPKHDRSITQLVMQGVQAPAVFTGFLIFNSILLGLMVGIGIWTRSEMHALGIEFRILQVHVQDQNAILIREGLKKPGDELKGPTGANP